ncbi:MAG: hypothetical protein IPK59_22575 [Rhodospirillaceae bacterium]|nr:hypothetical protein [Rhodospirillaceae bacterium]
MTNTLRSIALSASLLAPLLLLLATAPASAENAVMTAPTDLSASGSNNCTNGEIIDGSTAEQAITQFQAAGYSNVKIERKGCDNFWHATGTKGGQSGNIVMAPDGTIMPEGN